MTRSRETNGGVAPAPAVEIVLMTREAEARWSGSFLIEPCTFAGYLTARVPRDAPDAETAQCHAADLYLACACTLGIPEAVRIFEAMVGAETTAALRHMHLQPSAVDEVCQTTREKLLVGGAERAPRIAEYNGRGTLRGWMRVVITRIALNALRDRKREVPIEAALLDQRATDRCDPELSCLRERFGVAVDRALERAMRSLTPDQRVLLKQRFVDGLTSEQLARFHRKHRITMVRRLHGILRTLRARTEALLGNEIGCGHSTAVSIVNLALSQAHLSIRRLLTAYD
jgi:RNA polymerase sigma-70 factor (ECF subfamily)